MGTANKSPVEVHREGLLLEGALASDALGHGLTALRSYDFADKGRFFSGMFALTIGLERVLKLIFLISTAQDNGRFPTNKELKGVGHDVESLVALARSTNEAKSLGVDTAKIDDALCTAIIELLSRFARYARYYNLDSMTGSLGSGDEEPLAAWDRVVGTEVVRRHHRRTKRHRDAVAFGNALAGVPGIVVSHVLEDGTHATDTGVLTTAAVTIETKQKYSVYYVLCIVEFCVEVLETLDRRQNPPIYVSEYFRIFNTLDRAAVLRRKRWNPLP